MISVRSDVRDHLRVPELGLGLGLIHDWLALRWAPPKGLPPLKAADSS